MSKSRSVLKPNARTMSPTGRSTRARCYCLVGWLVRCNLQLRACTQDSEKNIPKSLRHTIPRVDYPILSTFARAYNITYNFIPCVQLCGPWRDSRNSSSIALVLNRMFGLFASRRLRFMGQRTFLHLAAFDQQKFCKEMKFIVRVRARAFAVLPAGEQFVPTCAVTVGPFSLPKSNGEVKPTQGPQRWHLYFSAACRGKWFTTSAPPHPSCEVSDL